MDITPELEFHGISINSQGAVELAEVKKLLDLYNSTVLYKSRLEAHSERVIHAMELQGNLIEAFVVMAEKIEKRHGEDKKTRKILDKAYAKIEEVSTAVDTLSDVPPIA